MIKSSEEVGENQTWMILNKSNTKHCFQKTQNYCCKVTANLNIHLEVPVSIKTGHRELHKTTMHERAAITKRYHRHQYLMQKDGVMFINPGQMEHQKELPHLPRPDKSLYWILSNHSWQFWREDEKQISHPTPLKKLADDLIDYIQLLTIQ